MGVKNSARKFSKMPETDVKKGDTVTLLKDPSTERQVTFMYPMGGGFLFKLTGLDGLYARSEFQVTE